MGCWGVGMQSGDAALDAIAPFERLRDKKAIIELDKLLAQVPDDYDSSKPQLGVAEYLLDKGFKLPQATIKEIKRHIALEMKPEALSRWTEPEDRKGALKRFRLRLEGKTVDERDIMIDNMGLLSKMDTYGMSRSKIKDLIGKKV